MDTSQPQSLTATRFSAYRLGDIARSLPGATAVFRKYRLDFCCGGDTILEDAARRRGLLVEEIERELQALDPAQNISALPAEPSALAAYIVTRYHDAHRAELPELIALAMKVERVHHAHPDAPAGLTAMLEHIDTELRAHMQKEENILFPLMHDAAPQALRYPIAMMRQEHDDHGELLARLETLSHNMQAPAEACNSWRALYAGLQKFAEDLREHIHTENNILFPAFDSK